MCHSFIVIFVSNIQLLYRSIPAISPHDTLLTLFLTIMLSAAAALCEIINLVWRPGSQEDDCDSWNIVDGSQDEGWMSWESLGLKIKVF